MNQIDPARGILKATGALSKAGLNFQGTLRVQKIELLSSVSPIRLLGNHLDDFLTVEPLTAYSINQVLNVSISGYPVVLLVGLLVLLRLGLVVLLRIESRRGELAGLVLVGFLTLEIPFMNALLHEVGPHFSHFALYKDVHEESIEIRSRLRRLRCGIRGIRPRNARGFFPRSLVSPGLMESNWMVFHFYGRYRSVRMDQAPDYVCYFRPSRHRFNAEINYLETSTESPE